MRERVSRNHCEQRSGVIGCKRLAQLRTERHSLGSLSNNAVDSDVAGVN